MKPASTRERLIDAAMELVAENGYEGSSIGDIEALAGLSPRSGAVYKYFGSKLEVLEAGLQRHLDSAESTTGVLNNAPITDLDSEVRALAVLLLAEMDRERTMTHVVEREGSRFPELRDKMREGISDRGYLAAAQFISRWAEERAVATDDHQALAVNLVGSLINLRRSTWTLGGPPLDIPDERIIDCFATVAKALVR